MWCLHALTSTYVQPRIAGPFLLHSLDNKLVTFTSPWSSANENIHYICKVCNHWLRHGRCLHSKVSWPGVHRLHGVVFVSINGSSVNLLLIVPNEDDNSWRVVRNRKGAMMVCNIDIRYRADSSVAPSQWETTLLCNDVSHWLGATLESALRYINISDSRHVYSVECVSKIKSILFYANVRPWTCIIDLLPLNHGTTKLIPWYLINIHNLVEDCISVNIM